MMVEIFNKHMVYQTKYVSIKENQLSIFYPILEIFSHLWIVGVWKAFQIDLLQHSNFNWWNSTILKNKYLNAKI